MYDISNSFHILCWLEVSYECARFTKGEFVIFRCVFRICLCKVSYRKSVKLVLYDSVYMGDLAVEVVLGKTKWKRTCHNFTSKVTFCNLQFSCNRKIIMKFFV